MGKLSAVEELAESPKHVEGLDVDAAEDGYIIYQPEKDRVHFLNHTAVLILELCNGMNPVGAIADSIQEAFGLAERPEALVGETVARFRDEGLLAPE
jgi:hypothetical protein